ncbi:hypothetical protein IQ246_29200 [aff. Roholtiella sp. LEGE 12411]|nr:hypothetical protein [aff. Roholtiella sp. LEGE 12411]
MIKRQDRRGTDFFNNSSLFSQCPMPNPQCPMPSPHYPLSPEGAPSSPIPNYNMNMYVTIFE